jgi:hypothetical protein
VPATKNLSVELPAPLQAWWYRTYPGFGSLEIRCWSLPRVTRILAVGAVTDAGQVTLNYASPDGFGHQPRLARALETRGLARGATRRILTSTETALRFYRSNGFILDEAQGGDVRTNSGYPMLSRSLHWPSVTPLCL